MDGLEVLGNRYRLVDCIGTGGMSVVWLARDETLGRDVVVKLLGPQRPGDTSSRGLIRQEAMAAAGLAHPNVTTVYDYGEVDFSDGETVPYVVMEYVRGRTLSSRLAEGPMPWREAVSMAADVAAALAAAHERGLVHRDVKPGNVILTLTGAKVLDFGIAAAVGTRDDGSIMLGTPAYVAPERIAGGPVHPAEDVYAVGLLLYKALAGRLPWTASTATQALRSHQHEAPAPLPDIPGMPPAVRKLCMRCLAKKPGQRPDSAALARQLHQILRTRWSDPAQDATVPRLPAVAAAPPIGAAAIGAAAVSGFSSLAAWSGGHGRHRWRAPRWVTGRPWRRGRGPVVSRAVAAGAGVGVAALVLTRALAPSGDPTGTILAAPPRAELGSQPVACQVRYATQQLTGNSYRALLTVTNTGARPVHDWSLSFPLPGARLLDQGTGARWHQSGGTMLASAAGGAGATIAPGAAARLSFHAGSTTAAQPPSGFTLNGVACAQTDVVLDAAAPARPAAHRAHPHGQGGQPAGPGKPPGAGGPGKATAGTTRSVPAAGQQTSA